MRHKKLWPRLGGYGFRGLYDILRAGSAEWQTLGFSTIMAYQNPASASNMLVGALDALYAAGMSGFTWMGGWDSATNGFNIDEGATNLENVMNAVSGTTGYSVKNHPALNVVDGDGKVRRRYNIADEPSGGGAGGILDAAEIASWESFIARLKALDPNATVTTSAYSTSPDRITQFASIDGVDEIWLSKYPNEKPAGQVVNGVPEANYLTGKIPEMTGMCEAANLPYCVVLAGHDFSNVDIATPETFSYMMRQAKSTRQRGYLVYGWDVPDIAFNDSGQELLKGRIGYENRLNRP